MAKDLQYNARSWKKHSILYVKSDAKSVVFVSLKSVVPCSYGCTHHLHWRPSFQLFVCNGLESWLGECHVYSHLVHFIPTCHEPIDLYIIWERDCRVKRGSLKCVRWYIKVVCLKSWVLISHCFINCPTACAWLWRCKGLSSIEYLHLRCKFKRHLPPKVLHSSLLHQP